MAPSINNPGGIKNRDDEIRDGVVSDATKFPGGFIDQRVSEAGAPITFIGRFQLTSAEFIQSLDVNPQDDTPRDVAFKPDGSQLYVLGGSNDSVYQYNLSTDYDVSTASFDLAFDVSPQDIRPRGVDFKPDGSQLYLVGRANTNVYQYDLSTDYDVSTASFDQSFDVSPQDGRPQGVDFKPDGSQLYLVGGSNDSVYQYDLSTDYDVSTASFDQSFDVSPQETSPRSVAFNPDGSQLYLAGVGNKSVFQYDLSTDYDVSTASFDLAFDVSPQDSGPQGVAFKPDGSQLYVVGSTNDKVFQYSVGTIVGEL